MISLSPRQSRGKIAAALILAPGVRGRRAARAAPSARLRQTRQARSKYHPATGGLCLRRYAGKHTRQGVQKIYALCELAHISRRRCLPSLGVRQLGGSHGKQHASRPLRRYIDARALPHVPEGRIGRPGLSAGGRGRRGSEGEGNQRLDARRRSFAASAKRLAPERSKLQRPRLLYLRQRTHGGEYVRGQLAVDLDQRNGVAAGGIAPDVERRDVDAGVSERRREVADEAGLVQIGDVDHRATELGI